MRARRKTRSHRPLVRFLARRLGALVLLLIGITIVSFVLTQAVPGDPALANLGQNPTPEAIQAFHEKYGLDAQAVNAMKQWLFKPGSKDGKPVPVRVSVEMTFRLK